MNFKNFEHNNSLSKSNLSSSKVKFKKLRANAIDVEFED